MKQGSLQVDGVEIAKIKMPETHDEIRYGQYLDFAMLSADISAWLTRQLEQKRNYGNQYRVKLAYATATIYDVNPKHLLRLKHDGIDFLETAFTLVNTLVSSFKPSEEGGTFEHTDEKGITRTYIIPEITQAVFRGTNNLPYFNFQQQVEIAECERILDNQIKKIDADTKEEKDIKGTIVSKAMQKSYATFENTMKKIVLCVTPHNEIPTDHTFDIWMEQKMQELKNISMPNALNAIFFLGGIPSVYGTSTESGFILSTSESQNIAMKHPSNTVKELQKSMIEENVSEIS